MTHLRQIMLEELDRRNYASSTTRTYIRIVEHFARHFHCPPDRLGPEHIGQYQAAMFRTWKLAPNTGAQAGQIQPESGETDANATPRDLRDLAALRLCSSCDQHEHR